MRPETTITLNKPSFRADEPITGFVDIDIKQTVAGEWDPKLWVVKVRLVGYAQMDTQWHGQARNPNWQEKTRFETLPIEDCQVIVRSTDVPVYVKPGVSNRVRSLPFQLQLSPAQLIASYNAQKGLFLVDYLLTATTRRRCPTLGWPLLKLESRTFVTITPPEAGIEKPLQVTPYSPPLEDMDLFRCPFMQTIRFNYSTQLTPSTMPRSHRMSIYFPRPLYEPEEISLSLTSTLCLQYNHVVNRHVESTDLNFETYYHPDTGGEEVLVEYDIPIKVPQSMDFKFTKGTMSMSHCLRVTMHAKLFPGDRSKTSKKTWSVDLPVTIKGRYYAPPSSPLSALTSPTLSAVSANTIRAGESSDAGRRNSNKTSETSNGSWIKDRFDMSGEESDDEGTMPTSAISATSSFATTTGYSENETLDTTSIDSGSPRRSVVSPSAKRQRLRVANPDADPPQKPAPTGPLPVPPESKSPSPLLQYRLSPEKLMRPTTGERSKRKNSPDRNGDIEGRKTHRGRDKSRSESHTRSRSVPSKERPENTFYDPFLLPASSKELVTSTEMNAVPLSASSISTKSTMPQTPTVPAEMPSYYHAKPSYYLDSQNPKTASRPRANTTGSSTHTPLTPTSPGSTVPSPPGSPQTTRVKFNPEISTSPSPPPMYPIPKSPPTVQPKSPARSTTDEAYAIPPKSPARSSKQEGYPFPTVSSPPPRKNSATPSLQSTRVTSPPPLTVTMPSPSRNLAISTPLLSPPIKLTPPVLLPPLDPVPSLAEQVKLQLSPGRLSPSLLNPSLLSPTKPSSSTIPRIKTARSSPPPQISTSSISSRSRSGITSPRIPPSPSRVARPPLPSHAKARITSMATTDTNTTIRSTVTNAATMSTAATSQSRTSNSNTPRVQLKRRPTNPSLFPPLPPATLAVQKEQVRMQQQATAQGEYRGKEYKVRQEERRQWDRLGTQDNRNWI